MLIRTEVCYQSRGSCKGQVNGIPVSVSAGVNPALIKELSFPNNSFPAVGRKKENEFII